MKLTDVIKPTDIDTSPGLHWFDTFDKQEREISARWIARFCQERGTWDPFTQEEIEAFYRAGGYKSFWWNGLVDPEYGIAKRGDLYHIENEFVRRLCKWLVKDEPEKGD
jgi:hypothetical protein